jgi:hypothetical protein
MSVLFLCGGVPYSNVGPHNVEVESMGDERFDWALKEATELVEFLSESDSSRESDWGFTKTIDNAIAIVDGEEKAQREREAAEKARIEKARLKAMTVRDKVIIPLLNDLRDDFADDEKKVLPIWEVQAVNDVDTFSGVATTPSLGAETCFTIRAEASVVKGGEFINLSVVSPTPDSKSPSAIQHVPLYDKTEKFQTEHVFDGLGSRTWFYKQLAESARICVLTKMRQFPTYNANNTSRVLVGD